MKEFLCVTEENSVAIASDIYFHKQAYISANNSRF